MDIPQIVQARALATKRGARYPPAEDLIFLIRHDRGKVNRLRTYLSWKDVRKHAKDSEGNAGAVEVENLEDGGDGDDYEELYGVDVRVLLVSAFPAYTCS